MTLSLPLMLLLWNYMAQGHGIGHRPTNQSTGASNPIYIHINISTCASSPCCLLWVKEESLDYEHTTPLGNNIPKKGSPVTYGSQPVMPIWNIYYSLVCVIIRIKLLSTSFGQWCFKGLFSMNTCFPAANVVVMELQLARVGRPTTNRRI